ncbi:hypothetical protein T484DRAFT_1770157 [Baffinella frigidus]|nr:hypothetical protein T484DRAFT_1770157 [Cryptophyta sp. CCMP2293]
MPLIVAATKLGICATALKKVCRKLGVTKWPYKLGICATVCKLGVTKWPYQVCRKLGVTKWLYKVCPPPSPER